MHAALSLFPLRPLSAAESLLPLSGRSQRVAVYHIRRNLERFTSEFAFSCVERLA